MSRSSGGGQLAKSHYENAPRFKRSKLDVAASATGWREPVPGRELHLLEAFHGALFHQLRANLLKLNLDIY
jgi:hypothetical protein